MQYLYSSLVVACVFQCKIPRLIIYMHVFRPFFVQLILLSPKQILFAINKCWNVLLHALSIACLAGKCVLQIMSACQVLTFV